MASHEVHDHQGILPNTFQYLMRPYVKECNCTVNFQQYHSSEQVSINTAKPKLNHRPRHFSKYFEESVRKGQIRHKISRDGNFIDVTVIVVH